jgi:AraC-like DNA-binding protein
LTRPTPENLLETLRCRQAPPQVLSLGRSIFDPIWREREHAGPHSELIHVLGGRADLVMRDTAVHGEAGDTLYTPKAAPHRDAFAPDRPFEVYLVHFEWAGEPTLLRHCSPARLAAVPPLVKAQVAADFTQLYRDFQQQGLMTAELTSLRLLRIILTLAGAALGALPPADIGSARRRWIMNQTRALIHQRYHEPLSLDALADALHVSPYHLSHVFSAESGFTLSSYLTGVRMERAAEHLRQGRLSIAEVARAVGFRDPLYFSRVFKSHYGLTPSSFRSRDGGTAAAPQPPP